MACFTQVEELRAIYDSLHQYPAKIVIMGGLTFYDTLPKSMTLLEMVDKMWHYPIAESDVRNLAKFGQKMASMLK